VHGHDFVSSSSLCSSTNPGDYTSFSTLARGPVFGVNYKERPLGRLAGTIDQLWGTAPSPPPFYQILPKFYRFFMTSYPDLCYPSLVSNERFQEGRIITRPERTGEAEIREELRVTTQRAFVIQFRPETDVEQGRFEGRVEHVASGQAVHFHSLDELPVFLARALTESSPQTESPDET
jgi:hypothetical protein